MGAPERIYCGAQHGLTRDHVPPRCLFAKPRPSDLITVPCCLACNHELAMHDEYFRIAVTTGIDRERFARENAESVRAINSLRRPASERFARSLLKNYDRNTSCLTFDPKRIEISLYRITRGLFFHHSGTPLPRTAAFEFGMLTDLTGLHKDGKERVNRLTKALADIGNGVFKYAFEPFEPPDQFGTFWLMRFYDHKTFCCITASQ